MDKKKKIWTIVLVIVGLYILGGIITAIQMSIQEDNGLPIGGYYIGEILNYEDIDIAVTGVTCNSVTDRDSDYYGLNCIRVYFTCKNNKTKDFSVNPNDIVLKTEDRNEKYSASAFSIKEPEKIIPGVQKYYYIDFYTPYTLNEKRFKIVLDWGMWSYEEEYHLYYRDGSNYIGTPPLTDEEQESVNTKKYVEQLQSELLSMFRFSVYEKITGSMTYSDVQRLIDSVERECRAAGMDVTVLLDLSSGSYFPKWNVFASVNGKKYALVFIEVECSTSFKVVKKIYGTYPINW